MNETIKMVVCSNPDSELIFLMTWTQLKYECFKSVTSYNESYRFATFDRGLDFMYEHKSTEKSCVIIIQMPFYLSISQDYSPK